MIDDPHRIRPQAETAVSKLRRACDLVARGHVEAAGDVLEALSLSPATSAVEAIVTAYLAEFTRTPAIGLRDVDALESEPLDRGAATLAAEIAHRAGKLDLRDRFLAVLEPVPQSLLPLALDAANRAGDGDAAMQIAAELVPLMNADRAALLRAEVVAVHCPQGDAAARRQVARAVRDALVGHVDRTSTMRAARALTAVALFDAAASIARQSLSRAPTRTELGVYAQSPSGAEDQQRARADAQKAILDAHADHRLAVEACATVVARARELLDRISAPVPGPQPIERSAPVQHTPAPRGHRLVHPFGEREIEHFIEHGWLKLAAAFPRETAEAWTQRAIHRIRTEPERCVRGYAGDGRSSDEHGSARLSRGDDARPDFSKFDPSDPSSWGRARIDYSGEGSIPLAEFSPRLWGAVDQLIGVDRLATHRIGEYLILNLRMAAREPIERESRWACWHLDAPRSDLRFDNIKAGLLLALLFSDIGPNMGATAIAPDSVGEVARLLAANKGGVDFIGKRATEAAMSRSTERLFLEGKAGDAYLLHPLMMHSVAPNPSGIIRWMTNPILFLDGQLGVDRDALSPVEEAMRRAIA